MKKIFTAAAALMLICSTAFAEEVKAASSSKPDETKPKEYISSQNIDEDANAPIGEYDDGVADMKPFDDEVGENGMINEESQRDDSWI
ncbi:MAG: hypothetical protein ABIH09_06335 [Candidatus Omnitrophota bacterium]